MTITICDCGTDKAGWHGIFCSHWAQDPNNESAPASSGNSSEGEITSNQEKVMNESIIPQTAEVDKVIREWAQKYLARLEEAMQEVRASSTFQEWAEEEIAARPEMTIEKCAKNWVEQLKMVDIPWPAIATPAWAEAGEVGWLMGGEVTVSFEREFTDDHRPGIAAHIAALINVVIEPEKTRDVPGAGVGTWFGNVGSQTVIGWDAPQPDEITDWRDAYALGRCLRAAADALWEIENPDLATKLRADA